MAQFLPRPEPVSPANLIDDLGAQMAARYAEAEQRMIERVANLAAQGIDATPDITDRLNTLRDLRLEGARIASELADPAEVARILAIAQADGTQAALSQLGVGASRLNSSGLTGTADRAVGALTLDLASGLDNMSTRITRWMPDAYQQVVSMTAPQVIAGVVTVTQAQRLAAQSFLARGVTGFTDRAGRNWRIGSYAEMATRTSVHRAWTDANVFALQEQAGISLVQIVIGLDACSTCAAHAGRVWSTDGTPAGTYSRPNAATGEPVQVIVAGTLDDARRGGWDHPNCRCTVVGYFPGLEVPRASTHDPQAEADRDRLRALERRVRDLKRREAATFDDVSRARIRRQIRGQQARIREHVQVSGQVRKPYREQLGFADGRGGLPPTPPPPPRPRTPTPPTVTPDVPAPVELARVTSIDEPPAWIQAHRQVTARLPADRSSIGRREGFLLDADEVREQAADATRLRRAEVAKEVHLLEQRKIMADDIAERLRTDPDFILRSNYGDLQAFADALGATGSPARYARDFSSGAASQRFAKEIAKGQKLLAELDDDVARILARTYEPRLVGGRPDLDELGRLGDETRDALDAIRQAGQLVDDEVNRRVRTLTGRPATPSDGDLLLAEMRAREAAQRLATFPDGSPGISEAIAEQLAANRAVRALEAQRRAALAWDAQQRAQVTREVLGELRDYGGGARSTYVTKAGRAAPRNLREVMEQAHRNYPTAWNDTTARTFERVELLKSSRGSNWQGVRIKLSGDGTLRGSASVATHELGHSMERAIPGLRNLEWAFHYDRSEKIVDAATGAQRLAAPRRFGAGYGADEVFVPDEFANNYTGKVYTRSANPVDDQWEIFTTGVESVFDGSPYFDRPTLGDDAGFRRFILGVLSAL